MKIRKFLNLDIAYREDTPDEKVLNEVIENNYLFEGVPEYKLRSNDIIIDVGAHIGAFSVIAALRLKKGKVYAIEPSKGSFELLKRNVELNKLSNLIISNLALGGNRATVKLYHNLVEGNWGDTVTKMASEEYEEVQMETLSNFMRDNSIGRCDFMKLNCEGSEFGIILNTPREILRRIKIMLILYHLDMISGYSESDLVKYLQKSGFFVVVRNRKEERGWIIAGRTIPFFFLALFYIFRSKSNLFIDKYKKIFCAIKFRLMSS